MRFVLEIDAGGNAAVTGDQAPGELARMLGKAAMQASRALRDDPSGLSSGVVLDVNGNRVGGWTLTPTIDDEEGGE